MARSMTGYGSGEAPLGLGLLTVEIRAVNHRYVDLRLNLPDELAGLAFDFEQRIRPKLQRGRFDVAARLTTQAAPAAIDRDRAVAVYRALAELRDELAPGTELPLSVLASMPDLFRRTPSWSREALLASFDLAAAAALLALSHMRDIEGRALTEDMRHRLTEARQLRHAIVAELPSVVTAHRIKLSERIARLGELEVALDPARLELEVAIFADRSDVSEELGRLESHFNQLDTLFDGSDSVGRKVDFLLQEIMRETNTLGSKSQSASIAHAVVELKTAIERLREQAQNLE